MKVVEVTFVLQVPDNWAPHDDNLKDPESWENAFSHGETLVGIKVVSRDKHGTGFLLQNA